MIISAIIIGGITLLVLSLMAKKADDIIRSRKNIKRRLDSIGKEHTK